MAVWSSERRSSVVLSEARPAARLGSAAELAAAAAACFLSDQRPTAGGRVGVRGGTLGVAVTVTPPGTIMPVTFRESFELLSVS